jgi:hypothetical protein
VLWALCPWGWRWPPAISTSCVLISTPSPKRSGSDIETSNAFGCINGHQKGRPIVARFDLGDWVFELFGDVHPVDEQPAWRHFDVERRLLSLDNGRLRAVLVRLPAMGQKTEPAFAAALGVDGDPYEAMLRLELEADSQLCARIKGLGAVLPIEGHAARD